MVVEPPDIAILATLTATHVNAFFGLPGTGRRIDFRLVRLLQMDGDSIKRERRIYDFTGVLVQVGVLRAKPASKVKETQKLEGQRQKGPAKISPAFGPFALLLTSDF